MKNIKLISQVRAASREIIRQLGLLENKFSSIGSVSQCHAIVELSVQEKLTVNQLADALHLEKSTISRLVLELTEQEICTLEISRTDRRNRIITLTEKGKKLAQRIHKESNLQVQKALSTLTPEEKETVVQGLMLYAQALKNIDKEQE